MKVILSVLFILCFSLAGAESIKETVDKMKNSLKPDIAIPKNEEMRARAKALMDSGYDTLMKKVDDYKKLIAEDNGYKFDKDETCHSEVPDKSLYIFISSSIPEETLKNYSVDSKSLNGSLMVINGVIGSIDKIMPTVDFLVRMSCGKSISDFKEGETCDMAQVDINPYLFRAFKIKSVPAFVHSSLSYSEVMRKVTLNEPIDENNYYKIYGDISIQYALEKFENNGVTVAKAMLQNLKRGFYDK